MQVPISNVIINYFLLHNDVKVLNYQKLQQLVDELQKQFPLIVIDNDKNGIINIQKLCSDFLSIDDQFNLIQNNILDYLQQLQPIYQWINCRQWDKSQQYYQKIKNFK